MPCSETECLKLYELLKEKAPSVNYMSMEVMDKGLLIEVYGYETDVKDLWFELKKITAPLKEITRKTGMRKYSVSILAKMIHRSFPPRLLVEVLRRMNYRAEYVEEEDIIASNAPLEVVASTAERVADLNKEVGKSAASTSTRYFMVAACTLTNLPLNEVIKYSFEHGLLRALQENKYVLAMDWRTALDLFLKNVKR